MPFGNAPNGGTFIQNDVPMKEGPEDFGGHDRGHVQQGVLSSFESDYIHRTFFNLLLQIMDAVYVDLATYAVRPEPCYPPLNTSECVCLRRGQCISIT